MKKADWELFILIVCVLALVSWFTIGSILPPPSDEKVKTAPSITASIEAPENNVILYDTSRPSWCPKGSTSDKQNATEQNESGEGGNANADGRQYINAIFNSCAINSSFTTTTE